MPRKIRLIDVYGDGSALVQDVHFGYCYIVPELYEEDATKTMTESPVVMVPDYIARRLEQGKTTPNAIVDASVSFSLTGKYEFDVAHYGPPSENGTVYMVWDDRTKGWATSYRGRRMWRQHHVAKEIASRKPRRRVVAYRLTKEVP